MKWISVKDRLPEYPIKVLCFTTNEKIMVMGRIKEWNINKYNITHWMPLPEPPEE